MKTSAVQRRVLLIAGLLAVGYPVTEKIIHTSVLQGAETLFHYNGTRGPLAGDKVNGQFVASGLADTFKPSAYVLWDTNVDVTPGTTVSAEWTLWCTGRPIYAEDMHVLADEIRPPGWQTRGFRLPATAHGSCEIRRHGVFISKDGTHSEEHEFPPLRFQVES